MRDHYSRSNQPALVSSCCWLAIAHGPIRLCRAVWGQYNSTCGRKRCVWGGWSSTATSGSQTHKFLWVSFNSAICLPLLLLLILPGRLLAPSRLLNLLSEQSQKVKLQGPSSTSPTPEAIAKMARRLAVPRRGASAGLGQLLGARQQ